MFYDYLISVAPTQQERDIICSIRDDERFYRDMVFEILTDEIKHAIKYNFIMNLDLRRKVKDLTS